MADEHYSYKGKDITIDYRGDDRAVVTIEGRSFGFTLVPGNLPMWACDDAYFVSPDIHDLARHLIDYWYLVTDPSAPPSGGHDHEQPSRSTRARSRSGAGTMAKKTTGRKRRGGHH